uniref:NADH dehydrogenase subunit 6 n=1 Tax=Haemonchus placei TaxID=6290 RepID=A0A140HBE9_HAEPC|nr:NADH dehydrogenase subunit 6 [Haemonchus placei]AMO01511.1 NADH dehydrogenase subunit 6 [Haemonchus placei]
MFVMMSVLTSVLSYLSVDPMKSSFFLILTLLLSMPIMSFNGNVWFVYFVCLLFLSGIFVILVYFSSLSSVKYKKMYMMLMLMVLVMTMMMMMMNLDKNLMKIMVSMNEFYYNIYWLIMIFILMILLMFMSFVSYYLNFSGALRKI